MRISIEVRHKQGKFPLHYRMVMVSLIKQAVRLDDEELYNKLYVEATQQTKPYTFAVHLANFKRQQTMFLLDKATLTISSADREFMISLLNGLQQMREFTYKEWTFALKNIRVVNEKSIESQTVIFQTLSPVLVESQQKKPLLIDDENFQQELNFIVNRQFMSLYGRPLKQALRIRGHELKKQVIQESNHATNGKTLYFTAQSGYIALQGDVEDLRLLYQDGVALRKSQGFGMLEVVKNHDDSR